MNDPRGRRLDVRELSDDELGLLLRQAFEFPSTPDLAPNIVDRLEGAVPDRRWRWTWPHLSRGMALALLALLVAAAVAGAALLGVPGIRILTIEQVDRPSPAASAIPTDARRVSTALGLGTRMPLEDIRVRVGMQVIPPTDPELGPPDAFYLDRSVAGGMVSMVWSARASLPAAAETGVGLLISQFDSQVNPDGFQKLVDQGVGVEPVTVTGTTGWWLHGATHLFLRRPGTGDASRPLVPTRLAGDTLLWERDGVTYRLEGSIGLERALTVAASIGGNGSEANGVLATDGATSHR
jgi:hypothetical protein